MGLRGLQRLLNVLVLVCAFCGCAARNEVIDSGDGHLVDDKGRPAYHVDDHRDGDWQWETESNTQMIEEGEIEDAVNDAER